MLGGANDLLNYLGGDMSTTPAQASDNIAASVNLLYAHGACNILVGNLPDLGLTPRLNGTVADQAAGAAVSNAFNSELATDLSMILATDTGLNLYNLDLAGLIHDAVIDPNAFGLKNVKEQAYTNDDTFAGTGTAVSDPNDYLFWDSIHPTTVGHDLIAAAALTAVPEPASLALLLALGAPMLLRRVGKRSV